MPLRCDGLDVPRYRTSARATLQFAGEGVFKPCTTRWLTRTRKPNPLSLKVRLAGLWPKGVQSLQPKWQNMPCVPVEDAGQRKRQGVCGPFMSDGGNRQESYQVLVVQWSFMLLGASSEQSMPSPSKGRAASMPLPFRDGLFPPGHSRPLYRVYPEDNNALLSWWSDCVHSEDNNALPSWSDCVHSEDNNALLSWSDCVHPEDNNALPSWSDLFNPKHSMR